MGIGVAVATWVCAKLDAMKTVTDETFFADVPLLSEFEGVTD
ncbi:adenylate cyclase, partial [Rhizobium leguminosarum]